MIVSVLTCVIPTATGAGGVAVAVTVDPKLWRTVFQRSSSPTLARNK